MPYLVGERRPELFVPGQDGAVVPRVASPLSAAALAALLAGPTPATAQAPAVTLAPTITINVTGGDSSAATTIAREVRRQLEDLVAQAESAYRTALHD